ncbi:MAG: endospore germination permease [Firmicutes bacterium]|nr:endospore germination permease [Bacillota bacterium]
MLEKGKISPRQSSLLLIMALIATSILLVPAITVQQLKQDAWLAVLMGTLWGLVTLYIVCWLGSKHPGQNIYEYTQTLLGKWPGKIVGLIYAWTFLRIVAIVIREFGDFMTTSFMPNTPLSVFSISLIFLAAWAVLAGLEVLARMNEFIIILVISSLFFILSLSLNNWDLTRIQPMFTNSLLSIIKVSFIPEVWAADSITLAVIIPFLTRPRQAFAAGTIATLFAQGLLATGIIAVLAIFGPFLLQITRFPILTFVRAINVGQILSRFEVLVMVVWVAGVFIKASYYLYCACLGLAQITGLKEIRPVVLPLGTVAIIWSFSMFENIGELETAVSNPRLAPLLQYLGIPLFLLIVTWLKEKFDKNKPRRRRNEKAN